MKKLNFIFLTFCCIAITSNLNGQLLSDQDVPLKDQVFLDDVIVDGSICVGQDCVNGESFGFDTERMKENNLRLHFDDTSSSASFPSNDWRIVINDSSNGGSSHFSVEDATGGRSPFRIEAGAPANSLVVESDGQIGVGTLNPVTTIHAATGNTPTLRLEQNGASGFTPQTWDIAGNEANFFIRDVTNGSQLAFRIFPNAGSDALAIEAGGNVGIGLVNPETALHVKKSSAATTEIRVENSNGTAQATNIRQKNTLKEWNAQLRATGEYRIRNVTDAVDGLFIDGATNAVTTAGDITANSVLLTSDLNLKTNVKPFMQGLSIVNNLNPISYTFNDETNFYKGRTHYSIGAQELQEVAPYLVHNFTYEKENAKEEVISSKEYLKIDFSAMTWVLVNSVKEQQAQIEELEEEVAEVQTLKEEVSDLRNQIQELKDLIGERNEQDVTLSAPGRLMQNFPNPHSGKTVIEYETSKNSGNAQIQLLDMTGKLIKTISVDNGVGQINLTAKDLPAGTYNYSLIVDGKKIDTKRMVISK